MSYSTAYGTAYDTAAAPPSTPASPLTVFREQVAAALEVIPQVAAGDWMVLHEPYDAVTPPAYMVAAGATEWGRAVSVCADIVTYEVVCIAARLTPEGNYATVEEMVSAAIVALTAARMRPARWTRPGPHEHGGVTYLAARMELSQPITHGG